MIVRPRRAIYGFAGCMALIIASASFLAWAKSQYRYPDAVQTAQTFLSRLNNGDFRGAHDLTFKSGYVGGSLGEFRKLAEREAAICWRGRLAWTSPPQTNGNRLRRRIRGESADMNELNLDFESGPCLLSVRLRRTSDADWKIFYFASHAG